MLFVYEENVGFATRRFLQLLGIRLHRDTISERLREHPDYPTLLSIKDVVSSCGMETLAVRLEADHLDEIHVPFLSQMRADKHGNRHFTVLRPSIGDTMEYLDPNTQKWNLLSRTEFGERFSPIALFAEAAQDTLTPDRTTHNIGQHIRTWTKYVLPIILVIGFGCLSIFQATTSGFLFVLYYLLFGAGAVIGSLLMLFEIDRHNPIVKQVCSGGAGKANCDAVLGSRGSRLFGLSWSQVGFTYFVGGFVILTLNNGLVESYLYLLALLSIISLPYIVYSLYYQWRVVRQWCRLCLMVQGVLLIQGMLVLWAGWFGEALSMTVFPLKEVIALSLVFGLVFLLSDQLIKSGQKAKEGERHLLAFRRIKSNLRIFESLLVRERTCTIPATAMGITLGNPEARHSIIKVCNPYCGPCAKAHPDIENLLRQNRDIKVTIIFTATGEAEDRRTPPVQHLLAIAARGDQLHTKKALNDWYLAPTKDYETFSIKHPVQGELQEQLSMIKQMDEWCRANEIRHTPTYFVNGHELPEIYSIADLDYLLKS